MFILMLGNQPAVNEDPLRNIKRSSPPFRTPLRNMPVAASLSVISPLSPTLPPSVYISQTANSMLWAIFNLSRNPGAQRRLLEEIRTVVPLDQDPCGEHIKSMPYLKACLKESMRYSRTEQNLGALIRCNTFSRQSARMPELPETTNCLTRGLKELEHVEKKKLQFTMFQNHRSITSPGEIRGKLSRMTGSKTGSVGYGTVTSNRQWSDRFSLPSSRTVTSYPTHMRRLTPHRPGNVYLAWVYIPPHPAR